ncbi:MAG TPA: hypothetical protein VH206_19330 [Xanthobacteraceae bacterium]|jgi:hypothetical protein|nr:hypothetical protein [Xanthobacteraceae bacterium]
MSTPARDAHRHPVTSHAAGAFEEGNLGAKVELSYYFFFGAALHRISGPRVEVLEPRSMIMTRVTTAGVLRCAAVFCAAMLLALSVDGAAAESVGVKVVNVPIVNAPVKGAHINPPNVNATGPVSQEQHASDQGVQINIRHKRDKLHGASNGGAKTQ